MRLKIYALLIGLFFLSFGVTWLLVPKEQTLHYIVNVEVGDTILLNPSPDLNFGRLQRGQSAFKPLTLRNDFFSMVQVKVRSTGNVSEWLLFEESFVLAPFSIKLYSL
jgi:hypothetical protein